MILSALLKRRKEAMFCQKAMISEEWPREENGQEKRMARRSATTGTVTSRQNGKA